MNLNINFFEYPDDRPQWDTPRSCITSNNVAQLEALLRAKWIAQSPMSTSILGDSLLHYAASKDQTNDSVQVILRYCDGIVIDKNAGNHMGKTALFVACENGAIQNVRTLLKAGCNPKIRNFERENILHAASRCESAELMEELLKIPGLDVNALDHYNQTPLFKATSITRSSGKVPFILLNHPGIRVDIPADISGDLPLHIAARTGLFSLVRRLLSADPTTLNTANATDITPLICAIASNHGKMVQYLLRVGANPLHQTKNGVLPLHFAVSKSVEMARLIYSACGKESLAAIEKYASKTLPYKKHPSFYSLTCCAIASGSDGCLKWLLNLELPRHILESPQIEPNDKWVWSPLAYLFSSLNAIPPVTFKAMLQLLVRHKVVFCQDFMAFTGILDLTTAFSGRVAANPFINIMCYHRDDDYLWLKLQEAGVTVDYTYRCYGNLNRRYSSVLRSEFQRVYQLQAFAGDRNFIGKLMVQSALLELRSLREERRAKPPLLQNCARRLIRARLRRMTVGENLAHFRDDIQGLRLPQSMKDYLMFRTNGNDTAGNEQNFNYW